MQYYTLYYAQARNGSYSGTLVPPEARSRDEGTPIKARTYEDLMDKAEDLVGDNGRIYTEDDNFDPASLVEDDYI